MPEVREEEHGLPQLVPLRFLSGRPHSALAQPKHTPIDNKDDNNHAQRKGCSPGCCQPACYSPVLTISDSYMHFNEGEVFKLLMNRCGVVSASRPFCIRKQRRSEGGALLTA